MGDHRFGHGMFPHWLPLSNAKTGDPDYSQSPDTHFLRRLVLPMEYSEIEGNIVTFADLLRCTGWLLVNELKEHALRTLRMALAMYRLENFGGSS